MAKQLDFDAYFDKIYNTIKGAAEKDLEAQIAQLREGVKAKIDAEFTKKVATLVSNEIIDQADAKDILGKYGIKAPMKKKAPAPTTSVGGCESPRAQRYGC